MADSIGEIIRKYHEGLKARKAAVEKLWEALSRLEQIEDV